MKANLVLAAIAAALFFPLAASAHDCSGGADGGMDATGNQCNGETVAVVDSSNAAKSAATGSASVKARKKAPCRDCATKGKVATRDVSTRARVKQG